MAPDLLGHVRHKTGGRVRGVRVEIGVVLRKHALDVETRRKAEGTAERDMFEHVSRARYEIERRFIGRPKVHDEPNAHRLSLGAVEPNRHTKGPSETAESNHGNRPCVEWAF